MLGYQPDEATLLTVAWASLVVAILCSTGGNVFAKWASLQLGWRQRLGLLLAIGVFCFGFLFYALALAGLPLGLAYPVLVGGSVTCVALIGILVLKERASLRLIVGVAMILVGMVVLHVGDPIEPLAQPTAGSAGAMRLDPTPPRAAGERL